MPDPRFESLGADQFQRFCQSLLTYEYPDLQALEVGQPDGGRDALTWNQQADVVGPDVVFQVKFVKTTQELKDPVKWVSSALREELPKIKKLAARGATRYRLMTNAGGSAHLDSGAVDKVNEYLADALPLPADCWWRADLAVRVVKHPQLRWGYPDLLTPADILKELIGRFLTEDGSRRMAAIQAFLTAQHAADKYVRFKQVDLQNDLLNLFIDVPASLQRTSRKNAGRALSLIRELSPDEGNRRYRAMEISAGAASILLHGDANNALADVVIEGAPGQGKSTLAQYLCQVHRMRLLRRIGELRAVPKAHTAGPARLPFKVDLRDFAAFLQGGDPFEGEPEWGGLPPNYPRSLEGFLASSVTRYSGGFSFAPNDLAAVLAESHALIVLDGLDEVAEFDDRRAVVEAIKIGINRLRANSAGLQTVVTSRPAAFSQSPGFPADEFPHLQLVSITPALIVEYAERWTRARRLPHGEARAVRTVLSEQLDQPHIRDLARNPMQLAILLTLILTKGDSLPDKRTDLYESYLGIFFDREAAKALVVRQFRDPLFALHEYLAWKLHVDAEVDSAGGSISQLDLESEVRAFLERQGESVDLAAQLFRGMVERVIALVSRVQGRFEFEVQPLREYFAASYLYSTAQVSTREAEKPGTIMDRFDGLARSAFWLNVVRFYSGFYNRGELPSLVFRLEAMNEDPVWTLTERPRHLAGLFLADWSFAPDRQSREAAITLALEGLGWRHVGGLNETVFSGARAGLPERAGRKEMQDRAWQLLASEQLPEDRRQAIELLVALAPEKGRSDWHRRLPELSGKPLTRWLETGLRTNELSGLSDANVEKVWGDESTEEWGERAAIIMNSGLTDVIESDEDKAAAFVKAVVVDGAVTSQVDPANPSWLGVLGGLRSPYRLMEGGQLPQINRLIETAEKLPEPSTPTVRSARSALIEIGEWIKQGMGSTELLGHAAERFQSTWGEGWGIYQLALAWVSEVGRPQTRGPRQGLCDSSRSIMTRVHYARGRGGRTSGDWWQEQFEEAQDLAQRMLCTVTGLSWASGAALGQILPMATSCLNEIDPAAFQVLLNEMSQLEWGRGAGKTLGMTIEDLERLDLRTALLLARRDKDLGRQLNKRALRKYGGDDPAVLSVTEEILVHEIASGNYREPTDLSLLKRCYAQMVHQKERVNIFRPVGLNQGAISLEIARAIVQDAPDFPIGLVQVAEARCYAAASKAQLPIRTTAVREEWFAGTAG